jgi:glutathione S-transferase
VRLFLGYRCPFAHRATIVLQEKKLGFEPVFFDRSKRPPELKLRFLAALEAWDRRLEGRTFLVRDALSLADVTLYTLFPSMMHSAGTDVPPERPHLRAWLDRMAARPTTALLHPR